MSSSFEAFESLCNSLYLTEFPCGLGTWREDYEVIKKGSVYESTRKNLKGNLVNHTFSVTLKDVDATKDRIENLSELITTKESPWTSDHSWCDEAQMIRDISIKEPWKLTPKYLRSLFRTVRIIDKNVTDVNEKMLLLTNLENLVLSANYIEMVDCRNLPKTLKSLELFGNFISDLNALIPNPPQLEHLGLGRNNLQDIGDVLNGIHWPQLLSLDLGHNHLTDLNLLLESLATLPKLRTLTLSGNPLSLLPFYRGLTIDRLRSLIVLDDVRISADERHVCRGFVRRRDVLPNEVRAHLCVACIKHLPVPAEVANPEEFPDFPHIQRKYWLQFWIPVEEAVPEDEIKQAEDNNIESFNRDDLGADDLINKRRKSNSHMSDITEEGAHDLLDVTAQSTLPVVPEGRQTSRVIGDVECFPLTSAPHTYAEWLSVETSSGSEQPVDLTWNSFVRRANLRHFRDFLLQSMLVELMEEKNLLYPPNELPQEGEEPPSKANKEEGKKSKEDAYKKEEAKPKKKKKVDESLLVTYSSDVKSIAQFNVAVSSLFEGQSKLELTLEQNIVEPDVQETIKTDGKDDKKNKVKSASKKKGQSEDIVDDQSQTAPLVPPPPPPVEVTFSMELIHYATAKECAAHV